MPPFLRFVLRWVLALCIFTLASGMVLGLLMVVHPYFKPPGLMILCMLAAFAAVAREESAALLQKLWPLEGPDKR